MSDQLLQRMQTLNFEKTPFVLVTIVDARGSLPQEIGAKCLITKLGLIEGTIGGGKLEAWAIDKTKTLLGSNEKNFFCKLNLQKDIGMSCGGEVSLFFETHNNKMWNIAVFGAGHVAQALCNILTTLDCQVFCIDTREEWLNKLPSSHKIVKMLVGKYEQGLTQIPADSFVLIITKGHAFDLEILKLCLHYNFPFAGGIGSQSKAILIKNELKKLDFNKDQIDKFICPIGLQLGNNTPAEISISITAQLIAKRDEIYSQSIKNN